MLTAPVEKENNIHRKDKETHGGKCGSGSSFSAGAAVLSGHVEVVLFFKSAFNQLLDILMSRNVKKYK